MEGNMIEVSVCKNHEGQEYHSIDIGNLKRVSNEMYEANERSLSFW